MGAAGVLSARAKRGARSRSRNSRSRRSLLPTASCLLPPLLRLSPTPPNLLSLHSRYHLLFEDGHYERRAWHDLRLVLVPKHDEDELLSDLAVQHQQVGPRVGHRRERDATALTAGEGARRRRLLRRPPRQVLLRRSLSRLLRYRLRRASVEPQAAADHLRNRLDGRWAVLQGLRKSPELNGRLVKVRSQRPDGRFETVRPGSGKKLAAWPANLRGLLDEYEGRAAGDNIDFADGEVELLGFYTQEALWAGKTANVYMWIPRYNFQ